MSDYSIVVSTFLRPTKLKQCLVAIADIPPSHRPRQVIVADDGQSDRRKDRVYEEFREKLDLTVVDLPYDAGLARKRNEGLARIDAEFVLFLDDDQYVPSNVYELTTILEENPTLGGIAPFWEERGLIKCNAADYHVQSGWALKRGGDATCEKTGTGHRMFRYDHIANAAMFRADVFDDYTWDESYVIAEEDTDFYLRHREIGTWEFAVTPNYVIRHDPGAGTVDTYEEERNDVKKINDSFARLCDKFDLKGVLHESSHHHPERPAAGKVAHWVAINVVPNRILWEIRRRELGFYLVDRLFPNQ